MNLPGWIRTLFYRRQLEREMQEEMRAHLEEQIARNVAAGMSKTEARAAAHRQFGGVAQIQERARDGRGGVWLENVVRDVGFAVRSLRRTPGFTLTVTAILAVAIGLVTAIINVSRRVLLPAIPFPDAQQLVVLREQRPPRSGYWAVMAQRFTRYAEHTTSFSAFAAQTTESANLVVGTEPYAVRMACVTEQFFAALGVSCRLGREFLPAEHVTGSSGTAVVLSDQAWTTYFGRDPSLLGREVMLGDQLRHIVGILPPSFHPPPDFADDGIYLPMLPGSAANPHQILSVRVIGRLKPGITREQAEAELRTTNQEAMSPPTRNDTPLEAVLISMRDVYLEKGAQPFRVFVAAVGLLYLIGCTSVTNLMLSRTVARRREMSVRLALGGSRRRVIAMVLVESLVLSLPAAAIGTIIAWWAQRGMTQLLPPGVPGDDLRHGWDGATAGIAIGLAVLTCMLAGLIPAWRSVRATVGESLKEGAGTQGESRRLRLLRSAFVVTQGALAVTLLIGAGLMIESVHRLQHIDLGFDPTDTIVVTANRRGGGDRDSTEHLNAAIVERLAALPEVVRATQTSTVPLIGTGSISSFTIDGRDESESTGFYIFDVSPDFFAVMDLPLLAGRGFTDVRPGDQPVAVIDQSTANQLFPDGNPIGRLLRNGDKRIEIIGIVRSITVGYRGYQAFVRSGLPVTAQIYRPIQQSTAGARWGVNAILRVARDPGPNFAATIRRVVYEIDPAVIVSLRTLGEFLDEQTRAERHTLTMLQILSGLAIVLAAFGMFSVMAYTVTERRGELGLRLVLGATPGRLIAFVLQRGLRLTIVGIALGVATAVALTRFMGTLLYETSRFEPSIYLGVATILLAAAVLACWLPAWRAARIDPVEALRTE